MADQEARAAIVEVAQEIVKQAGSEEDRAEAWRILKICNEHHPLDEIHDDALSAELTSEELRPKFEWIMAIARYGFDIRPSKK